MYEWMEGWADRPAAGWALFAFAWVDNIFFPIPSEALQYALYASRPKRAFWYATVVVLGTLVGATTGYLLGYALDGVARWLFETIGGGKLEDVRQWLENNLLWAVFVGSLSPFSDKTVVLGSGLLHLSMWKFVLAYTLGRAVRTFPAAALFYFFGPKVQPWIERYVEPIGAVMTAVIVALLVVALVTAI